MGPVQDAFAPVIEMTQQQHEAGDEEADIGGGEHDLRAAAHGGVAQAFHECLGLAEVLDDIEQEDLFEFREVDGELVAVEVPLIELTFGSSE